MREYNYFVGIRCDVGIQVFHECGTALHDTDECKSWMIGRPAYCCIEMCYVPVSRLCYKGDIRESKCWSATG